MFDFPNSPTEGASYSPAGGPQYVYRSGVWKQVTGGQSPALTAETRNRIVNGAMQISQENGDSSVGNNGYSADQWMLAVNSSSAVSSNRSQAVTAPSGGKTGISLAVSPAETSVAAGEYAILMTRIEGNQVGDFLLGTTSSKPFVIAFSILVYVAGTYWISITNGPQTHTYCVPFTIEAGETSKWQRKYVSIPRGAFNAGTWPVNEASCMLMRWTFMCGSTYTGVAGMQANATIFCGPGQANALSVGNASYLTDVGLYLDPDETGVPPPWQRPDYGDELQRCQRYWEKSYEYDVKPGTAANNGTWWCVVAPATTTLRSLAALYKVPKRVTPTGAVYSPSTGVSSMILSSSGSDVAASPYAANENGFLLNVVMPAAGVTGSWQWTANARM